jgi:NAD(P)-dependent dehydrogenase (short-subunit alcohol dehydrogenase family)
LGFVVSTLGSLLKHEKIESGARLCVVSSIWQEAARDNKLSYMVSKSAISGLIKSVAIDLAGRNILVNAVLPGVLDSPMTRRMLDADQIARVEGRTGFGRLISPTEVAKAILFLCSAQNLCITGQSIVADLGFTNVRQV